MVDAIQVDPHRSTRAEILSANRPASISRSVHVFLSIDNQKCGIGVELVYPFCRIPAGVRLILPGAVWPDRRNSRFFRLVYDEFGVSDSMSRCTARAAGADYAAQARLETTGVEPQVTIP